MNGGSEHLNGCSQGVRVEVQTMITNTRCGDRIVILGKGLSAVARQAHAKGFSVLFSQRGFHVAYPLLDVSGERAPPPTERQTQGAGIRDQTTLGHLLGVASPGSAPDFFGSRRATATPVPGASASHGRCTRHLAWLVRRPLRHPLPHLNDPAQPFEQVHRLVRGQPVLVQ